MTWNLENLKLSHKDPYQITKFSSFLSIIYGGKLKVKQVKVHEYIGMYWDYSDEVSVKFYMIKYTGKIFIAFPKNIVGIAASPSAEHFRY